MEPPPAHFQRYEQQLPRGVHTVHAGNCAPEILHLHITWACYWCPPHATELVHDLQPRFIMMPASPLHTHAQINLAGQLGAAPSTTWALTQELGQHVWLLSHSTVLPTASPLQPEIA